MGLKATQLFSLFNLFLIFLKRSYGDTKLDFNCENIYNHKNWNMLENDEYCGSYDPSAPYTYLDPEVSEPSQEEDVDNDLLPGVAARVMGGIEANAYPWLAQILWRKESKTAPICGGSLINKRYILSALHCVTTVSQAGVILERRSADDYVVRLGTFQRQNRCDSDGVCRGFEEIEVEEVILADNIINKSYFEDDIALLRLKTDVEYVRGIVSPICLPKCSMLNEFFEGNKVVFAGFGSNNTDPVETSPDTLQKFYSTVKDPSKCKEYFYETKKEICTLEPDAHACTGDSGGPLMLLTKETKDDKDTNIYYQIGILTGSLGRCRAVNIGKEGESTYTRVAYYLPWILDHIRE